MPFVPGSSTPFRSDINGLRAWALVAVILYHFDIPGFAGGFVGVDVFFVVSGYLMTGIVVTGLERQGPDFPVLAFYWARARRILPALIALCAVLMAIGWWVLMPAEYKALGTSAVFSLAFLSNIKFWREAGYFDAESHEKWLLHTWSLSAEWQFYVLLPIVLLAVWKWRPGRRATTIAMAAGLLASFTFSIFATTPAPTLAFYLLPTRAWEILAGGLVWLLAPRWTPGRHHKVALEAAGLALIAASATGFDSTSGWPGWHALVPVLGTVGVLLAARHESRWTDNPAAQWLGTRSYSIYLWHWPVTVALAYMAWQASPGAIAAGMLLTLVLGDLSYRWVEAPARARLQELRPKSGVMVLAGAMLAVACAGAGVRWLEGVNGRFSSSVEQLVNDSKSLEPQRQGCLASTDPPSLTCASGGDRLRAILIGDSHALAVRSALAMALPGKTDGMLSWTQSACPTLQGAKLTLADRAAGKCEAFLAWTLKRLENVPAHVPLIVVNRTTAYARGYNERRRKDANRPSVYFSQPYSYPEPAFMAEYGRHLTETACHLAKQRQVYLVRPIPEMGIDVPKAMVRSMVFHLDRDISISLSEYRNRHDLIWAAQDAARDRCGVKILDPLPYLCSNSRCHGSRDGRPVYYDDDHLNGLGNKALVPMFTTVFAS